MAKGKKKKKKVYKQPKAWEIPPPRSPEEVVEPSRTKGLNELTRNYFEKIINKTMSEMYKKKNRPATEEECKIEIHRAAIIGEQLYRQYDEKLVELHNDKYLSTEQIDKLDRIDLSEITGDAFALTVTDNSFIDYCGNTENMYLVLPCYQKGIFLKKEDHCVYFNIYDVDTENKSFKAELREYIRLDESSGGTWSAACGGAIMFDFNEADASNEKIKPGEAASLMVPSEIFNSAKLIWSDDFDTIYTTVSPKELGWNKEQCTMWHDIVLQNAVDQIMITKHIGQQSHIEHLIDLFIVSSIFTNYLLSANRPTIVRKTKDKDTSNRMTETRPVDPDAPRVRTLGLIKFVSPKPPARVNEKIARSYTMTEWHVKGFIRHYKSGKVAYIKPTIHKRKKGLVNTEETEPKQRITKLKDNKHLLNNIKQ